ncbi:MAG: hypothetical protein J5U17_03420 [Candidatus Methanoperedens sp.]|nr:hypothetical protein [Candidatus Methanoperedens sp.]
MLQNSIHIIWFCDTPDVGDVVPYENVDKEDAEDGIDKAEQIVELARTQIYKEGRMALDKKVSFFLSKYLAI